MGSIRPLLEAAVKKNIDDACRAPMRWGVDDCGLWVAESLRCLGYDPAAEMRGRYDDRDGAVRIMGKGGLARVFRRAARHHGWKVIPAHRAQVGDVGLVNVLYEGKWTLGSVICRAPGWFVGRNADGVTVVRADRVRVCWKVAPHVRKKREQVEPRIGRPLTPRPYEPSGLRLPEPVFDPIIIPLAIALINVGVPSSFAILAANAAVFVGLSVGLNYAASALQQRGNQPITQQGSLPPNDPSIRYNTRQPIPPKRIIYGTAQVGGALFFEQVLNPNLYQGLLLCAKPIRAIKKVWIGTNELSFTSLVPDTILAPLAVAGQPEYSAHLEISFRLGEPDQSIDPLIERDFGGLAGTPVSGGIGTNIGDMTGGGGLAAAFDGNRNQGHNASASKSSVESFGTCYVGKDYGAGTEKIIVRARVTSSNNRQFTSNNDTITISIQASTDNFSSSIVTLASGTIDESSLQFDRGFSNSTAYRYYRALFFVVEEEKTEVYCAELEFYEPGAGTEFRQRGIATAVLKYGFGVDQAEYTALWGQVQRPNPIFLVEGIAVPDPRKSGHILEYDPTDEDAVLEAEASWEWSDNAALCQAHFLTQRWGGLIHPSRIDWDKVAEAAEHDDSMIGTNEGEFIRRGTINGLITLNQNPPAVLSSLLSANRGFVLTSAGRVWVQSSPRSSVVTINDALISGAIEYRAAKPKKDMLNKIKTRFVAEDREYQTVDGPVLIRDDLIASDEEVLEGVLDLPFTLDHRRAQMLQKAYLETTRLGRRLNVVVDIEALANASEDIIGNAVTFDSDLFPRFNGTYFVESWGFTDNFGSIQLALSEYDPSIETDWHPETDQQDFTLTDLDIG